MEAGNERLFRVLGDVGSDLIATAEQRTFARNPWRRILPAAACLVAAVGLSLAAMPYFRAPRELATAPAAEQEAAVEESMSEPTAQDTEVGGAAEEQAVTNHAAEKAQSVQSKTQLVFWDTVYYVEAQYTAEEAEDLLGDYLGTVEQADAEANLGAAVYMRLGSEVREDYKERQVPLEIFVENEVGYLYCLTYYLTDGPLMEWEAVYFRWHAGKLDELVEMFVVPLERNLDAAQVELEYNLYDSLTELTSVQQMQIFLATLDMEQQYGTRTPDLNAYLWEGEGGYVIPVENIKLQLGKYLDAIVWQPELLPGYDAARNAVVLADLVVQPAEEQPGIDLRVEPTGCFLDTGSRKLTLMVQRYTGDELLAERLYVIRLDMDRLVYEYIHTVEPG